jgi:hypothetical protein
MYTVSLTGPSALVRVYNAMCSSQHSIDSNSSPLLTRPRGPACAASAACVLPATSGTGPSSLIGSLPEHGRAQHKGGCALGQICANVSSTPESGTQLQIKRTVTAQASGLFHSSAAGGSHCHQRPDYVHSAQGTRDVTTVRRSRLTRRTVTQPADRAPEPVAACTSNAETSPATIAVSRTVWSAPPASDTAQNHWSNDQCNVRSCGAPTTVSSESAREANGDGAAVAGIMGAAALATQLSSVPPAAGTTFMSRHRPSMQRSSAGAAAPRGTQLSSVPTAAARLGWPPSAKHVPAGDDARQNSQASAVPCKLHAIFHVSSVQVDRSGRAALDQGEWAQQLSGSHCRTLAAQPLPSADLHCTMAVTASNRSQAPDCSNTQQHTEALPTAAHAAHIGSNEVSAAQARRAGDVHAAGECATHASRLQRSSSLPSSDIVCLRVGAAQAAAASARRAAGDAFECTQIAVACPQSVAPAREADKHEDFGKLSSASPFKEPGAGSTHAAAFSRPNTVTGVSPKAAHVLEVPGDHPALGDCPADIARLEAALRAVGAAAAASAVARERLTAALVPRAAAAQLLAAGVPSGEVALLPDVAATLLADAGTLSASEAFLLSAPLPPPTDALRAEPAKPAQAAAGKLHRGAPQQVDVQAGIGAADVPAHEASICQGGAASKAVSGTRSPQRPAARKRKQAALLQVSFAV